MPFKKLWTFIRSYKVREMAREKARGPGARGPRPPESVRLYFATQIYDFTTNLFLL